MGVEGEGKWRVGLVDEQASCHPPPFTLLPRTRYTSSSGRGRWLSPTGTRHRSCHTDEHGHGGVRDSRSMCDSTTRLRLGGGRQAEMRPHQASLEPLNFGQN